jgi:hypothetical protein
MLSGGSADALLNSVALGFVLEVDDLMYHAFIPDVNKRMVGHMPVIQTQTDGPLHHLEECGFRGFLGGFKFIFGAWMPLAITIGASFLAIELHC